ncbi:RNA polymerase sigma factor [Acinetobacter sp.]|uniref:RNA polymerase sigma factor n=1 Tax=Acinetobacter sp. TaxID=472 RepID=UPI00388F4309
MSEREFLTIIKDNQGIIHKICRIYRNSTEDREDLFQEVIFQLWRSYPSFSGGSKSSTWLYRVALNTAMASFRKTLLSFVRFAYEEKKSSQDRHRMPVDTQFDGTNLSLFYAHILIQIPVILTIIPDYELSRLYQ